MNNCKIFNFDNNYESKIVNQHLIEKFYPHTVSDAGCLFYRLVDNKCQLLLSHYSEYPFIGLKDFGKKIELSDTSIEETIIQSVCHDTNNVINQEYMQRLISKGKYTVYYNKFSRYYMILVRVNDNFFNEPKIFGNTDQSGKNRTICWYDLNDVRKKIIYRLSNNLILMGRLTK